VEEGPCGQMGKDEHTPKLDGPPAMKMKAISGS